jgi:uncharacterized protein YggE
MNRSMWKFAGALGGALVILTLAFAAARPIGAQQNPPTTSGYPRSVTVVGRGEIKARPDTAIIHIGVDTEAKTAREALAQNNTEAAAVQKKLADLGIDAKDIQTSGFNIYPVYGTDGRQLTGYRVNNSVTVKIRGVDKAGALLDQVVQAGANSIGGITFTVDSPRGFEDQAREQAMRDAKARADLLARAAGASVGEVLVITENVGSPVMPIAMERAVAQDAAAPVPVQPGEQTIAISVQVTYALK